MRRTSSRRTDRRAGAAWAALAVLTSVLASGCVAMPGDGAPEAVDIPQGAGAENLQVRVFPVEPHPGADPLALLAGFLDASNADEANYSTALKYLTADARKRWHPEAGVVVLSSTPRRTQPGGNDEGTDISVAGSEVAELDAKHSYRAVSDVPYQRSFTFVKETEGRDKGEWRIDNLPDGLIVDLTNFKNGYRPVHRYFYSAVDRSAADSQAPVLVPDPIYLRRRIDPLTAAAQALADGPSDWLKGAVESAFNGVQVVGSVSMSDSQVAAVKVSVADFVNQPQLCRRMAGQLYYTLADQQPKRQLDRLDLSGAKGSCSVDAAQTSQIAPAVLAGGGTGSQQYYLQDNGQLMQTQGEAEGKPVPGALGQPSTSKPAAVAVRRDGNAAAVVSSDRKSLYVAGFGEGSRIGDPLITAHPGQPEPQLASPSWDGRQNLWLVDGNPVAPRVLMVRGRTVVAAQVDGLGDRTVKELKVSSDGARVALLLGGGSGAPTLMLGLVGHSGTAENPQVTITGLRPLAPQLSEIVSFSWADTDQLLVLGKEPNKLQQLHYVSTDGSQSSDTPQQVGDLMTSVSATESLTGGDLAPPVLGVSSNHQIYRLLGGQWRELGAKRNGTFFSYPS